MAIALIDEYSADGHLLYAQDYPGAYTRGQDYAAALEKMPGELMSYARFAGDVPADPSDGFTVVQAKKSALHIEDADSDVLFTSETKPLSEAAYTRLRALCLRSAADFLLLYQAVPDPDAPLLPARRSFYGDVPDTARKMYLHTRNVNAYYFGEIGIAATNGPEIDSCRAAGFRLVERSPDFLENRVFDGSCGEQWTLAKVLRRFLWHDRIHARAMYRRAAAVFGPDALKNPFFF